jgi:pSer/pThr/pTyr-binding forkhead associated (FHA) protein
MSESALHVANATVPATDRADQQPEPLPVPPVRPKLVVLRGMKIDAEYPIYEGRNTIGRFADKPVDIDLVSQESTEQIWCSRQHAVLTFDKGAVIIEDLNSLNGTWVNGVRIHAGQQKVLRHGDVVQIGTVQMKLFIG